MPTDDFRHDTFKVVVFLVALALVTWAAFTLDPAFR